MNLIMFVSCAVSYNKFNQTLIIKLIYKYKKYVIMQLCYGCDINSKKLKTLEYYK